MGTDLQAANDSSWDGHSHLSIGLMVLVMHHMRAVGVLDEETPAPPFPEKGDEAAIQARLSQRSPNSLKVPAWKFSGEEPGWLVTPEECALLAQRLSSHADPSCVNLVSIVPPVKKRAVLSSIEQRQESTGWCFPASFCARPARTQANLNYFPRTGATGQQSASCGPHAAHASCVPPGPALRRVRAAHHPE